MNSTSNNNEGNSLNSFLKNNLQLARTLIRAKNTDHSSIIETVNSITELTHGGMTANSARNLLVTGQNRTSNNTLIKRIKSSYTRQHGQGKTAIPVFSVATPVIPTEKSFVEAILIGMNDPSAYSGTLETKARRIIRYIEQHRVELLIVDEFQHFYVGDKRSQSLTQTSWLSNFLNAISIPVVFVVAPE